jgi:hypothetical protein
VLAVCVCARVAYTPSSDGEEGHVGNGHAPTLSGVRACRTLSSLSSRRASSSDAASSWPPGGFSSVAVLSSSNCLASRSDADD